MSEQFKPIENKQNIVKFIEQRPNNIIPESMFEIEDLEKIINSRLIGINKQNWDDERFNNVKKYITEGLEAELLNIKLGEWQKGKVRIKVSLEFCPDKQEELQSPLDEFRNQ